MQIQLPLFHYIVHIPSLEDEEELEYDGGGRSIGVELARAGHQHGPGHSAQVAQRIGVDSTTCTHREARHKYMYH